jgi:hypothetical protein
VAVLAGMRAALERDAETGDQAADHLSSVNKGETIE